MNILSSQKKRLDKLDKKRNDKCEPVAEEILQIIARNNLSARDIKDWSEAVKMYGPTASEINKLMKEKGFTISDMGFTWSVLQALIDSIKRLSNEAAEMAFDMAQSKKFGVDNMRDVTLQEIDNVLQS